MPRGAKDYTLHEMLTAIGSWQAWRFLTFYSCICALDHGRACQLIDK